MDLVSPERDVRVSLVSGLGHYEAVVQRVRSAEQSVWIATANVKELMVQDRPLDRGARARGRYSSVMEVFRTR